VTRRLLRFGLVAVVPTTVDAGLLVLLRQWAGLGLALANLVAIAAASALSYLLHRDFTFRRNPFVRWVRFPGAFAGVAAVAALCDTAVLVVVHGTGDGTAALVAAKALAIATAAVVRIVLYRTLLFDKTRRVMHERPNRPPAPGRLRASVVVPALDEAVRIGETIAAIRTALAPLAIDDGVEIIVVDDGSSDGTADAALAGGADQVVVLPRNRGKGAAVRAGVLAARGRSVAFTDADLSYSPDQVTAALQLVERGWDAVVGSRRHPEASSDRPSSTVRGLGSRAVNALAGAMLLSRPHDTQCGLKAFRSDSARLVFGLGRIDGFAFDIEVFHLIERYELALTEMPVRLAHAERSTVRAARDGVRLIRDLWRIRHLASTGAYDEPRREVLPPPPGTGAPAPTH
jgi:dolichyl-phosphate beta-glucosyltransferase